MQDIIARLNTAEHIFFRILIDDYKCKPKGLNNDGKYIHIRVESPLDLEKIDFSEYESKVQSVIDKNIEVKKYEIPKEDATGIDIGLVPSHVNRLRIVEIVNFDKQACMTPHVDNTSEIGHFRLMKITKKGKSVYGFTFELE